MLFEQLLRPGYSSGLLNIQDFLTRLCLCLLPFIFGTTFGLLF